MENTYFDKLENTVKALMYGIGTIKEERFQNPLLVAFKGCALRCQWCETPETMSLERQIEHSKFRCSKCGTCVTKCPSEAIYQTENDYLTNHKKCLSCGICTKVCPESARSLNGIYKTSEEVLDIIKIVLDKEEDATILFGGGEPLLQGEITCEIIQKCKEEGYRTVLRTGVYGNTQHLLQMADYCDVIYVDIKTLDREWHKKVTNVYNDMIVLNIEELDNHIRSKATKCKMIFQIPLVPGLTDSVESIAVIGGFIKSLKGDYEVELVPFKNMNAKYRSMNFPYSLKSLPNQQAEGVSNLYRLLSDLGLHTEIIEREHLTPFYMF